MTKEQIETIIKELKQYPREPKSLTWIESVLEKHLQEPTEEREVENKKISLVFNCNWVCCPWCWLKLDR